MNQVKKEKIYTQSNYFRGFLQKLIFNREELDRLKISVSELYEGELEPMQLKKQMLDSRLRIFEALLIKLPKFIDIFLTQKDAKTTETNEDDMKKEVIYEIELKEKDELLTNIGQKINLIHEKLKKSRL
ncbi:MAG: hypothetical protein ACTSRI_04920 [Promethearchaeota archaeon]